MRSFRPRRVISSAAAMVDPREPSEQSSRGDVKRTRPRGDHYHSVANPAEGEVPGERVEPPLVKNRGYRPGGSRTSRFKPVAGRNDRDSGA